MAALRTNDAYDHLFDYYGQVYNVDPALTKTAFHVETMGNPKSKDSPAGAQGGMQIMPALAAHYGIDPHDMTQAIPAATAYIAEGLQATNGDPAGALAYYNGGPKSLQRWKPETQGYVAKALSYYPQMKITNVAGPLPAGESTPPMVMADASVPDDQAFRSRWGLSGGAPQSTPDDAAFRSRWGLSPADGKASGPAAASPTAATPAPAKPNGPTLVSDAAGRAPDNLGDTELTTAQMAAQRAQAANVERTGYAALEPSEPGFPHLLWSAGQPFAQIGEIARGLRPIPQGVNALATAAPLAGVGDIRFDNPLTIFPRRSAPAGPASPAANPLASQGAPPPIAEPTFSPVAGRNFEVDAMGNVTQSGLPVPVGGAPEAPINPLASRAVATAPDNPLTAPTTSVATQGPIVQPRTGTALSPTEQAGYAAIRAPAAQAGAVPPGWASWNPSASGYNPSADPNVPPGAPPGTPPLGTPGYAHTTPGVSPAGLSPTEAAGYAAIHDEPPPAPMVPPMTKAAAQKVADNLIRYFHSGNEPLAPADVVVPPGYHPTLTGLTNDPGLATLHRGLESVNAAPAVVAQRNAQAINTAAHALQGDPGDITTMEAARDAITGPMREAAFANKADAEPTKVQAITSAANKILAGPDSKRPGVVKYVTQIRDALGTGTGNNAPETDPEMLYGVHKAINDLLSPLAQSQDADKQAASASLMKLKPLVQNAIESGAPGFKDYMAKHAELSKPIDAQRFLQSLNLTSATGDARLAAVDSAIKNIQKQQQLPGVPKAKWVTDDQMNQLLALRNALRMEAARGTGKPINSTTFQNLATNSMVSRIAGNPLTNILLGQTASPGLVGALAGEGMRAVTNSQLARSEAMVKEAVLERLLNFSGKGEATLKATPKPAPQASGPPWSPYPGPPPSATPNPLRSPP